MILGPRLRDVTRADSFVGFWENSLSSQIRLLCRWSSSPANRTLFVSFVIGDSCVAQDQTKINQTEGLSQMLEILRSIFADLRSNFFTRTFYVLITTKVWASVQDAYSTPHAISLREGFCD